ISLAFMGEAQFKFPTLPSLFTGFRPLRLSWDMFRPRPRLSRPILIPAGQYLQSNEQIQRLPSEVFSRVVVQPPVFNHQPPQQQSVPHHQPPQQQSAGVRLSTHFSSSQLPSSSIQPPPPAHIFVDHHHKASGSVPQIHHQPDIRFIQQETSSPRLVISPKNPTKPSHLNGFEPLRPESILSTEKPFKTTQKAKVANIVKHEPGTRGKSIIKSNSNTMIKNHSNGFKVSSFTEPLLPVNDNNIIGMLPPPPHFTIQS
ncbi:unnamed protein product, partial [Meganyctiphanes norvegica]